MASLAMGFITIPSRAGGSYPHFSTRGQVRAPGLSNLAVVGIGSRSRLVRSIRAAATSDDEEEDEQSGDTEERSQEEDSSGPKWEVDEAGRNHLRDLMKRKVRTYSNGVKNVQKPIEDIFFASYDKFQPYFEEQETEGMKQLLALVEADPVFKEPIYRERYPRYLMDIAGFAFIAALYVVVRRVDDYLDARCQRKANEMRASLTEWMKKNESTRLVQFLKRVQEIRTMGLQNFQTWLQSLTLLLQARLIELFNRIRGRFS